MHIRVPDSFEFSSISCGRDHSLALLASGRVIGWGGDGSGNPPSGIRNYCSSERAASTAVMVGTPEAVLAVSAGYGISLAIDSQHRVAIWGASSAGIGGQLESVALSSPNALPGIEQVQTVVAREFLFGAIDTAGRVHTWGLNGDGALGRATSIVNAMPGTVDDLPPASHLAVGNGYMLALTRDGRLYAWGNNAAGQLGLGHLRSVISPSLLPLQAKLRSVAAGSTHALAVSAKGEVLAWGSNHHGQLGAEKEKLPFSSVPVSVALPEPVQAVAAGMHFSLALGASGALYSWGWNGRGQLGLGDTQDRAAATRVPGLAHVLSVAAGETHAVALSGGRLHGWGNNSAGQIGKASRQQLHPISFFPMA